MSLLNKMKKSKAPLLGIMLWFFCSSAWAQVNITGTVVSATDNEPLIGATIMVKGTNTGATTDTKGKYTIKVDNPGEAVLVITYLGYTEQETAVQGRSVVDIVLKEDMKQLDEVVVIGYGTVKKKDLTGSVTMIKTADITSTKSPNPLQALQGKAAGIDMTQSSGQAGSPLTINMRGNRSLLASNAPLILVDGVEYGSTLDINPSDIESMDVLKDASSTAIYGTRGANGVILITTKKGAQGKSRVTFSTYGTYNMPTFIPKIMNSQQYVEKRLETLVADREQTTYANQAAVYNTTTGTVTWNQAAYPTPYSVFGTVSVQQLMDEKSYTSPYQLITADPTALQLLNDGVSINYMDLIFRNSYSQNYELGASGGNEKTKVNLSLGLLKDNGLLRNDNLNRYNFKIAIDHNLFKKVTVGSNVMFTRKKNLKRDNGIFIQAIKTGTVAILTNPDGTYKQFPDLEFTRNQANPMLDEASGAYLNDITSNRLFGTAYVNWDIAKGVTLKTNFGVDLNNVRNGLYQGPTSLRRIVATTALTQLNTSDSWNYTWENTLNATKKIDKHEINLLLGHSMLANASEVYQMVGIGQKSASTEFYDWNGFSSVTSSSSYTASQLLSFFGRLNYKFNEKYLFTGSLRADGTSVLKTGKQWGYFPSAAFAWRVNEEGFLKGVGWISNLKTRISWGVSGNSAVLPYQTITQLGLTPAYYSFDDKTYSSLIPSILGNPTVKWETTENWDLGIDLGFFNRINGSVDLYVANTTDLLLQQPLPGTDVYSTVLNNIGSTRNKGIEVNLNTQNIKTRNFEWTTDWNFAANKDEVRGLTTGTTQVIYADQNVNVQRIWRVGSPTVSYYDYKKDGLYQLSDLQAEYQYIQQQQTAGAPIDRGKIPMISNKFLPGDIKLHDANGDGVFNENDKVLYNNSPKYTFGVSNTLTFGNLSLSAIVIGRIGQKVVYGLYQNYKDATLFVENGPYVNAWTPTNTGADFPRYYTSGNAKAYNTTLVYLDGSFVKIKDITLSYSLPKKWINKAGITGLKLYATGKNLFTFSKIDNYDPEVGGTLNFPLAKQYIVGLNLDF